MQSCSTIIGVIRMKMMGMSYPQCQSRYQIGSAAAQLIMKRYREINKAVEELETMEPAAVEELFYPHINIRKHKIPLPDFELLFAMEKGTSGTVLVDTIWKAYHHMEPDGYGRSQFYEYCSRYVYDRFGPDDLSMGINRVPGERVYIDWCGAKPEVHILDRSKHPEDYTELQKLHLYVTAVGFSSRVYAEAALNEKQMWFNMATVHALQYYAALPRYLVPDNLKTGVTKNTKDEVIINASFQDLERFFDLIVLPPPYYKPKGKPTAERYVQQIQQRIGHELEKHSVFRSLDEVNELVMMIVEEANNEKVKGYGHTHNELFEMYDRPAMRPMTDSEYTMCDYAACTMQERSYHVYYDDHFYSVPYRKASAAAVVKATADKIFICDRNNNLIAEHKRCYIPTLRYISDPDHMPQNHRFYDEVNSQTADYYLERAKEIGTCMHILMHDILKSAEHEEQMYRACNSIIRMCEGVPKGICEEAAMNCVKTKRCRYSDFRETLSDLLAQRRLNSSMGDLPEIDDVRGKGYYR